MTHKLLIALLIISAILLGWWDGRESVRLELPQAHRIVQASLGTHSLAVEMALTPSERAQGLSGRDGVSGSGMVFVFPQRGPATFWNRGMRFSLLVVWIDGDHVVGSTALPLYQEKAETVASPAPVTVVLELPLDQWPPSSVPRDTPWSINQHLLNGRAWQPLVQ